MADKSDRTHTAFTLRRENKRYGRWLEIGTARLDSDGTFHAFLDRLPIGGFTGYVHFALIGEKPPEPQPERPGEASDDTE